jgi:hypothetical protein
LFLSVASAAGDALVVTLHTVDTMTSLGKHQFVDAIVTGATFKTVGVVRVIAGHNGFVKDGLVTDATAVWTIGADRLTVWEEKEIGVGGDPVAALGTLETVDVKEGLTLWWQESFERWLKKMKQGKRKKLTRTRWQHRHSHPWPFGDIPGISYFQEVKPSLGRGDPKWSGSERTAWIVQDYEMEERWQPTSEAKRKAREVRRPELLREIVVVEGLVITMKKREKKKSELTAGSDQQEVEGE